MLLEESEEIYSYMRTLNNERLLVICSFSKEETTFNLPSEVEYNSKKLLIGNYDVCIDEQLENIKLRPYECRVYII